MLSIIALVYNSAPLRAMASISALGLGTTLVASKVKPQDNPRLFYGSIGTIALGSYCIFDTRGVMGLYQFSHNSAIILDEVFYIRPVFGTAFSFLFNNVTKPAISFSYNFIAGQISGVIENPRTLIGGAFAMGAGSYYSALDSYNTSITTMGVYNEGFKVIADKHAKGLENYEFNSFVKFLSTSGNVAYCLNKVTQCSMYIPLASYLIPAITQVMFAPMIYINIAMAAASYIAKSSLKAEASKPIQASANARDAFIANATKAFNEIVAKPGDDAAEDVNSAHNANAEKFQSSLDALADFSLLGIADDEAKIQLFVLEFAIANPALMNQDGNVAQQMITRMTGYKAPESADNNLVAAAIESYQQEGNQLLVNVRNAIHGEEDNALKTLYNNLTTIRSSALYQDIIATQPKEQDQGREI